MIQWFPLKRNWNPNLTHVLEWHRFIESKVDMDIDFLASNPTSFITSLAATSNQISFLYLQCQWLAVSILYHCLF